MESRTIPLHRLGMATKGSIYKHYDPHASAYQINSEDNEERSIPLIPILRGVGRKLVLVWRWFARGARPKFLRTLIIHEQSRTFYGAFYQLLSPAAHAK